MSTAELQDLETQVDHLLRSVERLKLENHSLKTKLTHSIRERAELQQQGKAAACKIKSIVSQLKEDVL